MTTDASLFDALISGNARKVMDELFTQGRNLAFSPLEERKHSPGLTGTAPECSRAEPEGSGGSTAGVGPVAAGSLYPVTCRARYYDAASRILEDEPRLFTHDNADELGHVIQKWIEETRNNWEPK